MNPKMFGFAAALARSDPTSRSGFIHPEMMTRSSATPPPMAARGYGAVESGQPAAVSFCEAEQVDIRDLPVRCRRVRHKQVHISRSDTSSAQNTWSPLAQKVRNRSTIRPGGSATGE
jgi:hypothetical protein